MTYTFIYDTVVHDIHAIVLHVYLIEGVMFVLLEHFVQSGASVSEACGSILVEQRNNCGTRHSASYSLIFVLV